MTPAALLEAALRHDGARPLITWYDDSTGERVELSVVTAANWAAKTANLLGDDYGLEPGDTVGLAPTSHWLSVVALLGAWTAGVGVDLSGRDTDVQLPGDPPTFMAAVLPQPDALLLPAPAAAESVAVIDAVRSWTLDDAVAAAGAPPGGCRILTTLPLDDLAGIVAAVLAPLVADGSAVLVVNADPSRLASRADAERVTHTAGVDLAGVARLSG